MAYGIILPSFNKTNKRTFRGFANRNIEEDRKKSAEQFLEETVTWFPWEEENLWYDTYMSMDPDEEYAEKPPISELVTVEEINEDKTRFTLTFHRPGYYELMYKGIAFENFYLISPEETTLAAMAAEMDEAVEQAKKAPTEKAAAQGLFQWVRRHVKYNHPAWDWLRGIPNRRLIPRDPKTAWEPFGALIYGKAFCAGYAKIYHTKHGIDILQGCNKDEANSYIHWNGGTVPPFHFTFPGVKRRNRPPVPVLKGLKKPCSVPRPASMPR